MASKTYRDQVIVLKKTKLKESDLILTLLAADGRQIRAVAKGARKPTSTFAARLDLFSSANVLFAEGRNLDIVKEARLIDAHVALRGDIGLAACAAPMVEILAKSTQADLPVPRLYDMTQTALSALEQVEGAARPLICAAFLLKACAVLGFRPQLACCVECGFPVLNNEGDDPVRFSAASGGALCTECVGPAMQDRLQTGLVNREILRWAEALIGARFAEMGKYKVEASTALAVLRLVRLWTREHIAHLKSVDYLLTSGLY